MFSISKEANKNYRRKVIHICMLITLLGAFGCNDKTEKAPDVSGVKVELNTRRFDKDLGAIDTNHIAAGLQQLKQKYPDFLDFFLDTLMGFRINAQYTDTTTGIQKGLRIFLTYKDYRLLFDTVSKHYPDTKDIDEDLEKGFQYMVHYFPGYRTPKVIYMLSWLNNWGAFTISDSIIGVGLDMFLGASYPYYKSVGIPDYMGTKENKDYIPVAVFSAVYENKMPFQAENATLLDMMLQKGKEMYFLSKILPFVPEEKRFGYTKDQLDWCYKNEAQVYNFFIRENLLYDNNWQKILRYVKDAPTATGMAAESPGNIGSWLGLQIVKAYMNEHSQMDLQQLLKDRTASQQFLQLSKYKPK
jgi:hypothetical protein